MLNALRISREQDRFCLFHLVSFGFILFHFISFLFVLLCFDPLDFVLFISVSFMLLYVECCIKKVNEKDGNLKRGKGKEIADIAKAELELFMAIEEEYSST